MAAGGEQSGKKARILVVDDDENMRKLLSVVLTSKGHEIFLASGPIEGIEAAARKKPDLIVLDLFMAPISGMDVLVQLRQVESSAKTPVLMLTAANTINTVNQAFDLGVTDYITKPINLDRLQKKIAELLVRGPQ